MLELPLMEPRTGRELKAKQFDTWLEEQSEQEADEQDISEFD
ncbi:hypothetical protein KSX_19700 [Ktedonospora formicarum]|uniref:Uncharacterized protein n=1 Tax=Ktedonospora formicarum TaxID=2778364 RepID=A0A8J3I043_9CHLR|nr:hypothetical protein KSX_19700 [Ktedonospora formicarum]